MALHVVDQLARLPKREGWFRGLLAVSFANLRRAIQQAAQDPDLAHRFAEPVDLWLEAVDDERYLQTTPTLRRVAFDTLLGAGEPRHIAAARRVFERLPREETDTEGRLLEAEGRFKDASQKYTRRSDQYRCLRKGALWTDARKVAPESDHEFLDWLIKVQGLVPGPSGLKQWLNAAEREGLDALGKSISNAGLQGESPEQSRPNEQPRS